MPPTKMVFLLFVPSSIAVASSIVIAGDRQVQHGCKPRFPRAVINKNTPRALLPFCSACASASLPVPPENKCRLWALSGLIGDVSALFTIRHFGFGAVSLSVASSVASDVCLFLVDRDEISSWLYMFEAIGRVPPTGKYISTVFIRAHLVVSFDSRPGLRLMRMLVSISASDAQTVAFSGKPFWTYVIAELFL